MESDSINFADLAQTYSWPSTTVSRKPHVRLNMAVNTLGESVDHNGTSTGLSFPEDRKLLTIIRSGAQAVIVGASTIRTEGWNLPHQGLLVVLTRSESLPWESCPDLTRVRVISNAPTMQEVVNGLAREGIINILVEGGATLARVFSRENLYDDVCLTISLGADSQAPALGNHPDFSAAVSILLGSEPSLYELVSAVSSSNAPAVFTVWRRAMILPLAAAH